MNCQPHEPVTDPHLEGYNVVRAMWLKYWNPEKKCFISPNPRCSGTWGDEGKFNVWSVAVAAQAIVDGARIYPKELGPLIEPVIQSMYKYRSGELKGYCAVENFNGNKDIYYDDDAQVASVLITAYEVTGNKQYLDAGRELVRYLMGGWNNDSGANFKGGVLWHRDKSYVSAISTSECAVAALRLAKFIPNEQKHYVKFAAACFDWLFDKLLDKSDYLVQDGIDKFSDKPNGMKWSYNSGVALTGVCLLYQLTGEQKWLEHALKLAAAVTDRNRSIFCRDYGEQDRRYWRDPSYFIQLLYEGLADFLLMVERDKIPDSTVNAINLEFKRHFEFFRKYLYDPQDGLYFQMFEAFKISKDIHKRYCEQFGDSKRFEPNSEERAVMDGDINDKPVVKTLIGSGAAARIWFQGARVVPTL